MTVGRLVINESIDPMNWGKVYSHLREAWHLKPNEISEEYSVSQIMALLAPDGELTKEQFDEIIRKRQKK